ncbi:unnamed protein product, partial [Polarella glacialis]
ASPSPDEIAAGCPYINQYCQDVHSDKVKCLWTSEKGRVLRSEVAFTMGDIVFREPPLHLVAEDKGNPMFDRLKDLCSKQPTIFEYEPLWYWTALNSLPPALLLPGESRIKSITQ